MERGTRGAPPLFLGLGVLITCVCSNCEPSTNRTLMSCTLLASPLYFSKSLRKRKKKTESNLSKVTWWVCWQNRVLNLDQNPQSYPGSLLVHWPGGPVFPRAAAPPQLEFCVPGVPGNPALGYASCHHFHGIDSLIISLLWPLAPSDYLLSAYHVPSTILGAWHVSMNQIRVSHS